MSMPQLPVDQMCEILTATEEKLFRACIGRQNRLKSSKPFSTKDCEHPIDGIWRGKVNYVWRMLCFDFVPYHPHCCMPVTADMDIHHAYNRTTPLSRDERWEAVKTTVKELDDLTKRIESALPVTAQRGAMRWASALGLV